jgi:hypothetical protein
VKEYHNQAKEITDEWYSDLMQLVETHESGMELMMHPDEQCQYGRLWTKRYIHIGH